MKTFKRNAVIITVLLFVCVAAYLNWSYNKNSDNAATAAQPSPQETASSIANDQAAPSSGAGLYYDSDSTQANKEYFDAARLNRQQARDAAAATLTNVSKTEGASKQMTDTALKEISKIASDTVKESQLESLIKAKGFSDCVVYISDTNIDVTVPAPADGLPASSVAKITDIVTSNTSFKAADLHVIPIK